MDGEKTRLRAFDEDNHLVGGLDRDGAADGHVVKGFGNRLLADFKLDVDLRLFLLGLQKDFRSMRHFKGGVLEVAALKLEHGFRSGFLLGLLIILVLGVFVFCHFGFLARRPRGQPELNN